MLGIIGEDPVISDGKIYLMGDALPIHNGEPRIVSPALRTRPHKIDGIGAEPNKTRLSLSIDVNSRN